MPCPVSFRVTTIVSPSRAAETLTNAVLGASANGVRTPDLVRVGVGATTREFADVVISHLPHAMTTAEFYREAIA